MVYINDISHAYNVLYFHIHTSWIVLNAQCGCVLWFVFSQYIAEVLFERYGMVPVAPVVTGVTFVFYIPHVLCFYGKAFKFQNLFWLLS